MTVTHVVGPYDDPMPEAANVEELAAVLELITTDLQRWEQNSFCAVPSGVDSLKPEDLEAGVYHDFTLSEEVIEALRERRDVNELPIANCGTALCVAGHVAVRNGWTFYAEPGEDTASRVIPTPQVELLLKNGRWDNEDLQVEESGDVAREVLNVNGVDANALFAGGNTLLDLWSIGYAITGGRLELPEALPETKKEYNKEPTTNALMTADDVLDAVHVNLAILAYFRGSARYARLVDLERALPLLDTTDHAVWERRRFLTSHVRTMTQREVDRVAEFVEMAHESAVA